MRLTGVVAFVLALLLVVVACSRVQESADDAQPEPVPTVDQSITGDDGNADQDGDELSDTDDESERYPVSAMRSDGDELTLEAAPERIVSLSAGATETLFAIGAGDQVAAVEMFSDYPPVAAELPRVDAFMPDPEAIVSYEPDLVIVIYNADDIVSVLDDLGLNVLYLEAPRSLDELFEQTLLLGELTGNLTEARDLVESLESRIAEVTDAIAGADDAPRIYHELDETFFTVGVESFIGDVYKTLGVQNIAEGASGEYPQLSEEVILDRNPDVIIVPTYPGMEEDLVDRFLGRPGWDVIDAVEQQRIYAVDGDSISRPGPRIVDVLEQLAELLYPGEFDTSHEPVRTTSAFATAA